MTTTQKDVTSHRHVRKYLDRSYMDLRRKRWVFKSLKPEVLPDGFDAKIHGVKPIVKVEESNAVEVIEQVL